MFISDQISLGSSQNENVSDGSCRENQNIHFVFNNLVSENRAFYETMWKNMVEPDRTKMAVWRMLDT
jgi:hypothetical protein